MQRAILVGVNLGDPDFERSIEELDGLAGACDIETAGIITQNLDKINPATYVGSGKLPEIAAMTIAFDADLVIFNDELSPSQIRNLEQELDCSIMDRTALILEIFSRRAKTREAKLQVEVAHLQYMLPRLVGLKQSLEQQTGGVGTTNRGAGEKQLELNRRQIQNRIARLRAELDEIVSNRETQRRRRKKSGLPVVSLVGYTNAGKSTIMNTMLELTAQPKEKKVFEKDMLFATLETSVRSIVLPDKKQFLLTDTVGFIDRLPTNLIKAFRSTLEEAVDADLIIHVVDCSDPNSRQQIDVTNKTLADIGVEGVPMIYAFNKADKIDIKPFSDRENSVYISAKYKTGMDELMSLIRKMLFGDYVRCTMLIPYKNGDVLSYLSGNANIISTAYENEGTRLDLELKSADYNRFRQFVNGCAGAGRE